MRNENKTSETPENIKFNIGDIVKLSDTVMYTILSSVKDPPFTYGYCLELYETHTGKVIKEVWSYEYAQIVADRVVSVNRI